MRKAPPKFVVEHKGGRRQKRPLKSSIWGDTDFKSLSRQIAADFVDVHGSNHLDMTEVLDNTQENQDTIFHSDPREVEGNRQVLPRRATMGRNPDGSWDQTTDASGGSLGETRYTDTKQLLPELSATWSDDNQSGLEPNVAGGLRNRASEISEDRHVNGLNAVVSRAALAALDAENIRLKTLLARKLESENRYLDAMLRRFLR